MLHEFPDAQSAAAGQAEAVVRRLREALACRDPVGLALSGGRSPALFFDALSRSDLDWSNVVLRLVDDRLVPPTHPHSNERLVRERLLQRRAAPAHFEGLVASSAAAVQDAAAPLAAHVARLNAEVPLLDLAVLGMGDDGHIASLFSGAPEFAAATDLANPARYCIIHPPAHVEPAHPRISMTLAALLAVDRLVIAFSGVDRRAVFERALRQPRADLPVSLLLDAAKTRGKLDVYWHP